MNDLDELRTLRDDVPSDPASLIRARRRLTDRTSGSRRRLTFRGSARGGSIARRAALATGAIAAAAVGVVVLSGLPIFDNTPASAPSAAAAVFNEAARNADKARPGKVRAGQYLYTRTHSWTLNGVFYSSRKVPEGTHVDTDRVAYYMSENVHELWRPAGDNHATLIRVTEGLKRKPLRPSDVQNLKDAGVKLTGPPQKWFSPDPSNPKDKPAGPVTGQAKLNPFVNPTPETLATLPRDPDQLLARIRKQAGGKGNSRDGQALVVIADLFRQGDALIQPELRAALFRAAAKIPGIERRPGQATLDGQRGIAIGRAEAVDGTRQELIVDPASSRIIGERSIVVAPSATPTSGKGEHPANVIPVGTVTGWSATRSTIVNGSGQTKPAR